MVLHALQIAGLVLGFVGMAGTLGTTLLPQWRVSAFIGSNIVVFERIWEGLWMNCVRQAKATLQCKLHGSLLALPPVLEAARALMCVAVALSLAALLVGVGGMKCVQCAGSSGRTKACLLGTAGVLFLLTGLLVLIPVSWTAHIVIRDFHNPAVHVAQKRELGAALFLGWASAAVLFLAGGLLCGVCCCHRKRQRRRDPVPGLCAPRAEKRRNGPGPRRASASYV
ncbi:claudin-17 [Pteronotus mesoamericanus]|uniref:claudin-17 n=1 Tax=Pteronotus mesoamericanus TaxID=1884717 RepID=UPI0023EB1636|nr:claudin-17 [Pteronotus parnellii mesoamericanus]